MTKYITAVPAYGRDYKTQKEVRADWEAGRDFLIQSMNASGYISKDDKPADVQLNIRFAKQAKVCVIR